MFERVNNISIMAMVMMCDASAITVFDGRRKVLSNIPLNTDKLR